MATTPDQSPRMSSGKAFVETLRDGDTTGKTVMSLAGMTAGAVTAQLTHLDGKGPLIAIVAGGLLGWAYGKNVWAYLFHKKN